MTRILRTSLLLCLGLMSAACTGSSYDPSWGAGDLEGGKADGFADTVQAIAFGETVQGEVTETSVEFYSFRARAGDRVSVKMEVSSGDLNPHVQLYQDLNSYIESDDFQFSGDAVTKGYTLDGEANYVIVARAFRNEGRGTFSVTLSCEGGPCANEAPPDPELSYYEQNSCIADARYCAFERIFDYDGRVGPVRSQLIWNECLGVATTDSGKSCAAACDKFDYVCDYIVGELPFFADQTPACVDAVTSCMDECATEGDYESGEYIPEMMCLGHFVFGGSCTYYARKLTECGGTLQQGSYDQCHALCETTVGAWLDDLDVMCDEMCTNGCSGAEEDCFEQCDGSDDPDCIESCMVDRGCY